MGMKHTRLPLTDTGHFPEIFTDYVRQHEPLAPFYGLPPTIESFAQQIAQKESFPAENRRVLYEALTTQYAHLPRKPQLSLDLLKQANTFTVTTGHQLNIFTGPLYFHYKIMTVINAAKALRSRYPDHNFVPVYWMASEDHDAEEISSFRLFGTPYRWDAQQHGAVGRFAPQSLLEVIKQVPEMDGLFAEAYGQCSTLADATRMIVHELYASEGLIVIDGDDRALKQLFVPVMRRELTEQTANRCIGEASAQLASMNYKIQVNPREINLFYLADNLRERIVREGEHYAVLNTDMRFTAAEIDHLLNTHPEHFSPNVVLRPLYQEVILPNLSYTGGPGEFAYWLQLKPLFDTQQLPFPILLPRNFALVINKLNASKMEKLGLQAADLFLGEQALKQKLIAADHADTAADLTEALSAIEQIFQEISQKAATADKTLTGFVLSEQQKTAKSVENIEKRIRKALEQKSETEIKQMQALLEKLFPKGGLQERTDNFLNFYLNDRLFIHKLMQLLDPFDFHFHVFEE
jgi:bacillithiol biosynthesis cysteine-adding enzyme BshC